MITARMGSMALRCIRALRWVGGGIPKDTRHCCTQYWVRLMYREWHTGPTNDWTPLYPKRSDQGVPIEHAAVHSWGFYASLGTSVALRTEYGSALPVEPPRHLLQILHERPLGIGPHVARRTEDRARMHRCEARLGERGPDQSSALCRHADRGSEQRFRRRGAERHDDARLHDRDLLVEPRMAGTHLGRRRRLVDASLAGAVGHPL